MTFCHQKAAASRVLEVCVCSGERDETLFVRYIRENFVDAPSCHIELIFKRFAKIRMYFEGEFIDSHWQVSEINAAEIESSSHSSKSARAVTSKHL